MLPAFCTLVSPTVFKPVCHPLGNVQKRVRALLNAHAEEDISETLKQPRVQENRRAECRKLKEHSRSGSHRCSLLYLILSSFQNCSYVLYSGAIDTREASTDRESALNSLHKAETL